MMKNRWRKILPAAICLVTMAQAQAGVIVGGTRLVYDGGKKESSLTLSNPDKAPYLIQSWVDAPEGSSSKPPFIITPPIFRLDGGQDNILRVIKTEGNLPTDKESLFWINIKSIPSTVAKKNTLQIAVKTRIKLIYRPAGLNGNLTEAAAQLKWQRSGGRLDVTNPTPFYLTFFNVKLNGVALKDAVMVAPFASAAMTLPATGGGKLSWQIINDYGGASQVLNAEL